MFSHFYCSNVTDNLCAQCFVISIVEATWLIAQTTHLLILIQHYFWRIVIYIAVFDRWQSTDQFCRFQFFITQIFH